MDNSNAHNQLQPPTLHDILAQLMKDNREILSNIRDMQSQVLAFHNLLAKRRLPSGTPSRDTLEGLATEMQTRLDKYFTDLFRPMRLHDLTRIFARRLRSLATDTKSVLSLMPNVHEITCATGGIMLVPENEWRLAGEPKRQSWLGTTTRELDQERKKSIDSLTQTYERWTEDAFKEQKQTDVFEKTHNALQATSTGKSKTQPGLDFPEGHVKILQQEAFSSDTPDPFGINPETSETKTR